MRGLVIVPLLALLPACVLHAKQPLFSDADGVLVLGARPVTVTVTALDGEKPFNFIPGHLNLVPEGNHYRITELHPKGPTELAFVPLAQGLYALQYGVGQGFDYALARWDGRRLMVAPLDCARLKTDLRSNLSVEIVNTACRLAPGTEPHSAFASFVAVAPPARPVMQGD